MTYRRRNILIAAALAVLAVVFMMVFISKARTSATTGKQLVSVLVASHDIKQGTPGSTLQSGAFTTKLVPRSVAVPDAITSPSQVSGEVTTQDILAGDQVSARRFSPLAASGVRSQITGFERVVQLSGDPNQVLDGTLSPGDHVDVLGSWTPVSCQTCKVSGVIVRNALVLKTSAELGSGGSGPGSNLKPVQLRLTDEEANAVFWMEKNGAWWLMLRPVIKPKDNSLNYNTASSILQALKKAGLIR